MLLGNVAIGDQFPRDQQTLQYRQGFRVEHFDRLIRLIHGPGDLFPGLPFYVSSCDYRPLLFVVKLTDQLRHLYPDALHFLLGFAKLLMNFVTVGDEVFIRVNHSIQQLRPALEKLYSTSALIYAVEIQHNVLEPVLRVWSIWADCYDGILL